jgi:hypothetical protein
MNIATCCFFVAAGDRSAGEKSLGSFYSTGHDRKNSLPLAVMYVYSHGPKLSETLQLRAVFLAAYAVTLQFLFACLR